MHVSSQQAPQQAPVDWRDGKRALWSLSIFYPLLPLLGMWLHAVSGTEAMLWIPVAIAYGLTPLLDWWLGEDENNPPEAIVPELEADRYYRVLTWLTVPVHFVTLIACAWWAAREVETLWGFAAVAVTAGLIAGFGINTAHELGHKNTRLERNLAKWALAVPFYGHFCVEHNRGHHTHVATPEDPASARMGESIYRFALREIPGAIKRAWQVEAQRLGARGQGLYSVHNQILQSYAISIVLQGALLVWLGPIMLPFLIIHNVLAWWQLTSANYIEHYGLLRSRDENGRYERCKPHHSWNSNHKFSNLVLFHLERHSDHHANPGRRYQALRHFEDLPQLPNGYFGMYLLAYIPPLWFRVMDKRVLTLPHIQGDLSKINIDPDLRNRITESRAR